MNLSTSVCHPEPLTRRVALTCWVTCAAVVLSACGGGEADKSTAAASADEPRRARALAVTVNPSTWVAVTQPNDLLLQNLAIPADAPTRGMWSGVGAWPMLGLHQAVLPDGKVLTWGTTPDGGAQNGRYFDVWDPNRGLFDGGSHNFTYDPNRQDSFCAPAIYLNDGRLMITGGNADLSSQNYTPSSNSFARGANMADARWYGTMVSLADGRPLMLGGINPYTEGQWTNPDQSVAQGLSSMTPEVYENGNWRTLFGAQSRTAFGPDFLRASLPKAWLAPDGRVFGIGTDQMYYVDANANGGNGGVSIVGRYKAPPDPAANNDTANNVGPTMSGVMYAPGKVLTAGGGSYQNGSGNAGSRKATSIDLNSGGAAMTELPPMAFARNFGNLIVLPDGKVLATGGETRAFNNPSTAVYAAEQWNPATNRWSTLASASVFRGYHSMTALLTNGTVLSTGGGNPGPVQLKGEVFYPPYLFRSVNGAAQLAPRPRMVGISGLRQANGAQMQIDMASNAPVTQLVLIGLSVGTHSFNSGQRRIPVSFTQEDIRLTATLPRNTLAPPGYYQVIAIDANGVPSRGTVIAVGQGVNTPFVPVTPYNPPTIVEAIDSPVIAAGTAASYTVAASAGVTYSWTFGDGSAPTAFSTTANISHRFATAGVYGVTLTARAANGTTSTRSFLQAVSAPATAGRPVASGAMALETRPNASARLWVANPDTDTVAVIDAASNTRVAEIGVGSSPRSVGIAPDGRVWITNKGLASISIVNPATLSVAATVALPRASQPHGLVFASGGSAFVVLEATGQMLKLDPITGATQATLAVGANPRHLSATADGATLLVSRFITNALPGEATATVDTSTAGAEVLVVNGGAMTISKTVVLRHSDKPDNEVQGSGIPNYLAAAVISPDGKSAWVPSKQDNIKRGSLRNNQGLNFQNSVRAISSRIDMAALAEDYPRRIDHDNASLGSAAAFHPSGAYLFVALETSRQVAVVDAAGGRELAKFNVGRAPQALRVSADGKRLYVQNFMDRNVSVMDLGPLVTQGLLQLPVIATVGTIGTERLSAQVLLGKQLFYDARDPRLARDSYMSCASCHSDAGHDGRTWDFSGFGEGLRNTPALKGRAATAQGFVHWSANFDEIQDFEGQIRNFAGGTGLMSDAQFNTGTRNQPLGDRKAGVSADLDALAAYLGSLNTFDPSPLRNADGSLTATAEAGKLVFNAANCASCHVGSAFTVSGDASQVKNVGTLKPASGKRLGGALAGLDVPTLRDAWKTAPYLHDGSAATLAAAVQAHQGIAVAGADLDKLVAYLQQVGGQETTAPGSPVLQASAPGTTLVAGTPGSLIDSSLVVWTFGASLRGVDYEILRNGVANGGYGQTLQVAPDGSVWAYASDRTWWRYIGIAWVQQAGGLPSPVGATLLPGTPGSLVDSSLVVWTFGTNLRGPDYEVLRNGAANGGYAVKLQVAADGTVRAYASGGSWWRYIGSSWQQQAGPPAFNGANTAPSVALTAPANNASAAQGTPVTITATASDSDGTIGRVEFYDGATLLGTSTAAPYTFAWNGAAAGAHSLTARAYDNAGAVTTSSTVSLTVTAVVTPAANAVACGNEGGTCSLPAGATANVWYGANASWALKTGVTGSIGCSYLVFGDPLPGFSKSCRYLVTATSTVQPSAVGAALLPGTGASLVDKSGVVWTFGTNRRGPDYEILRNGATNGGWAQRLQVAPDGSVWAFAALDLLWWRYDGSAWVKQAGGLPSNVGTSLLPGAVGGLIDQSLVVWTFGTNQRSPDFEILRNGLANGGFALKLQVARDGSVWAYASNGTWWVYNGSGWLQQAGVP